MSEARLDVLVVGAGIAGAGVAAALAAQAPGIRAAIIEAEAVPAYHSTGRSAAFWHESYGGPGVRPLTDASFAALAAGEGDDPRGVLSPRGAYTIGRREEAGAVAAFVADYRRAGVAVEAVDRAALAAAVPGLKPAWVHGAAEARCSDIDVARLHQRYLTAARRAGMTVWTGCALTAARRDADGWWRVRAGDRQLRTRHIVNAAGAWADAVARLCGIAPVGITPYRRTIVQVRLAEQTPGTLPLVIHVGGDFYFRGEGPGRIWLSPHDETPEPPGDTAPVELDVALALARLADVVEWPVAALERRWAGQRSFASDRLPVLGRDAAEPSFIWCAGQGGFGIQTAPAVSALTAAAVTGASLDAPLAALADGRYAPDRLALRCASAASLAS